VANGTTNDVKINACIFCFRDCASPRIHVPDSVRNSGGSSHRPPFSGVCMRSEWSSTILINNESTNPPFNTNVLQKAKGQRHVKRNEIMGCKEITGVVMVSPEKLTATKLT
jgi:hypothetical protein